MPTRRQSLRCLTSLLLAMVLITVAFAQQPGPVQYVYDALGRLVKVIDGEGNVAEYVYDAVGNILEIRRSTLSGLAILDFSPQQGPVGTVVTIQGQGFSATSSENTVEFNGATATVSSATETSLVVTVPPGATTGLITVTVAGNAATSDRNFTVLDLPVITSISPTLATPGAVIPDFQVTGANLTDATFTFVPELVPPAVVATPVSIDPTGTAATLSVTVSADAAGAFVLVATNTAGSSDSSPSPNNTLTIIASAADDDRDGLTNQLLRAVLAQFHLPRMSPRSGW